MGKLAWRRVVAFPKVPMETPLWGNCTRTATGRLREARQLAVDPAKEPKEGCLLRTGLLPQVCAIISSADWFASPVGETQPDPGKIESPNPPPKRPL